MTYDAAIALALFALVASITPGPSNFMLLTSGANFGFRRTLPQVFGITVGFSALLLGVGLGLGALLTAYPPLYLALKVAGSLYLLYLAWRIAMSRALSAEARAVARPMTFLESAIFQWINPKGWVVAMTVMAIYVDQARPFLSVAHVILIFAIVNLPSVSTWAGFGVVLRQWLADPKRLKWFNIAMGVLLVATLWPMLR